MELALSKMVKGGTVRADIAVSGYRSYTVSLDGAVVSIGDRAVRITPLTVGAIRIVGMMQESKVALTLEDYQSVESAGSRSAAPVAVTGRPALVAAVTGLEDEAEATFERLHAAQDATAWTARAAFGPRIAAARQALADFDAAQPEVIAAIRAERAESADRNRWM